jgi:NAD(P)-dependent dehydrogenase (short-subunit alcohol dehydrogenase family)
MTPVEKVVRSHFITARAAARRMVEQKSGVIIFVTRIRRVLDGR